MIKESKRGVRWRWDRRADISCEVGGGGGKKDRACIDRAVTSVRMESEESGAKERWPAQNWVKRGGSRERGSAGKGDASASTCGVRGSCIGEEARRLTGTE